MLKDVVTEDELKVLLGVDGNEPAPESIASLQADDKRLIHALVRNQLRLLHMVEELQAEVRSLKATASLGAAPRAHRETAAGLEPLPLPFMRQSPSSAPGESNAASFPEEQKAPAADVSRKERFKRKSLW